MQNTLNLPPQLTIYTVAQLRPQWLDCASTAGHWQADASAVDEIDAAGVQMLVSLAGALALAQGSLSLVNAGQPLADACRALGASMLLAAPAGVGEAA